MSRAARAARAAEMAALIERWEESGLSQRVFAEQEGVAYSAFQYWRRRLLELSRKKTRGERAAPVQLSPVRIIPDAPRATPSAGAFELRTPTGLAVSVPVGFDERELRRLLETVSGC